MKFMSTTKVLYGLFNFTQGNIPCKQAGQLLPDPDFADVFRVCHLINGEFYEEKRRCKPGMLFSPHKKSCLAKAKVEPKCPKYTRIDLSSGGNNCLYSNARTHLMIYEIENIETQNKI